MDEFEFQLRQLVKELDLDADSQNHILENLKELSPEAKREVIEKLKNEQKSSLQQNDKSSDKKLKGFDQNTQNHITKRIKDKLSSGSNEENIEALSEKSASFIKNLINKDNSKSGKKENEKIQPDILKFLEDLTSGKFEEDSFNSINHNPANHKENKGKRHTLHDVKEGLENNTDWTSDENIADLEHMAKIHVKLLSKKMDYPGGICKNLDNIQDSIDTIQNIVNFLYEIQKNDKSNFVQKTKYKFGVVKPNIGPNDQENDPITGKSR